MALVVQQHDVKADEVLVSAIQIDTHDGDAYIRCSH